MVLVVAAAIWPIAADLRTVQALADRAALAIVSARRPHRRLTAADYEAIYLNSPEAVVLGDPEGRILGANPAACEVFQWSEEELCRMGRRAVIDERDPATAAVLAERRRVGRAQAVLPVTRRDGSVIKALISSTEFTNRDGELRACMILRDVTDEVSYLDRLEESAAALASHSVRDPLTQLWNRRGLEDRGGEVLARADRDARPIQVLFFDLDNLKQVNDAFGHRAGDSLLRRTTAAIAAEARSGDLCARIGGDEFVVVLESASPRDAQQFIERLRQVLRRGVEPVPVFSVGVAERVAGSGETLDEIVHRADRAMYEAKTLRRFGQGSVEAGQEADRLSDRELRVLHLLAGRVSNREIAGELFVSVNTVKTHLKRIYRKLGVASRSEAVQVARQRGLIP